MSQNGPKGDSPEFRPAIATTLSAFSQEKKGAKPALGRLGEMIDQ